MQNLKAAVWRLKLLTHTGRTFVSREFSYDGSSPLCAFGVTSCVVRVKGLCATQLNPSAKEKLSQ